MAKATVSRTALGAATCRLMEQYQPERTRLFTDPVVAGLISLPIRFTMSFAGMRSLTIKQMDAITKGIYGTQVCRTRYIDDAVLAGLAEGSDQLVLLGAGFDTRPYRLPGMDAVKTYEVDLPAVQQSKVKKLANSLGAIPEGVTFIPIDFDKQSLEAAFAGASFDLSRRAIFAWEGVTQYITEAAVRRTLEFVSRSAPGSVLVFTYVLKSMIERRSGIPGAEQLLDFVANDSPWTFGLEPSEIPAFLEPYRLRVVEDVGNADYQERYLKPVGRELSVTEIERIVQAKVV